MIQFVPADSYLQKAVNFAAVQIVGFAVDCRTLLIDYWIVIECSLLEVVMKKLELLHFEVDFGQISLRFGVDFDWIDWYFEAGSVLGWISYFFCYHRRSQMTWNHQHLMMERNLRRFQMILNLDWRIYFVQVVSVVILDLRIYFGLQRLDESVSVVLILPLLVGY